MVCKTFIHRFDSDRRLQQLSLTQQLQEPLVSFKDDSQVSVAGNVATLYHF